jgi:MFS family permease
VVIPALPRPTAWLDDAGLDRQQRASVLWLLGSVLSNSVFCRLTVFGSAFVLFLDHLGLDKGRIGLLLSLIPFAGLLALVCAPFVARIGYRAAYIGFFSVRKAAIALLLALPWVSETYGSRVGLIWVAGLVLVFAICRAIGEIGAYAVFQEVVPNPVRGRFSAATYAVITVSGIPATLAAGWVLRGSPDTARYLAVIGIGLAFGIVSVASLIFVRAGAPESRSSEQPTAFADMRSALTDSNFVRYMAGVTCAIVGLSAFAFAPLFYKECAGLRPGLVVWMEAATAAGGLAAAGRWGRAADRRGSRPVLLVAIVCCALACLVVGIPGAVNGVWSALALSLFGGAAQTGWYIGAERYLFVRIIPPERKAGYIAVYYALAGVAGGTGPLVGGRLVEAFRAGPAPYAPLFLMACGLGLCAALILRGLEAETEGEEPEPSAA